MSQVLRLNDLSDINENLSCNNDLFIISDQKVWYHYGKDFKNLSKNLWLLENGEEDKSLAQVEKCISYFIEKKINRNSTILALGGGLVTDFAGFVASIILRGVPWIAVPTTLLGQVDAAIGGKVAVNTKEGKNLIGSFYHPKKIYISNVFLESLSSDELQSGKGEVLKYCFLSKKIFDLVNFESSLDDVIDACIEYKIDIATRDFKEAGLRKILNLGHTYGHAIEKSTNIPHGLAVALGLKKVCESFSKNLLNDFDELVKKLNIELPEVSQVDSKYIQVDKKRVNQNEIDIVIPTSIGEYQIQRMSLDKLYESFNL